MYLLQLRSFFGGLSIVQAKTVEASMLYRAYNPNTGEHLYTQNQNEIPFVVSHGWRDEGVGFYATNSSNSTSSIKELEILKQNYTSLNGTWTNSHGYQIPFNNRSIKLSRIEINGRTQFSLNNPIKVNNVLFISFNPVPALNGMQIMVALKGTSPSSGLIGSDGTNRDNDRIIMANNGGTSLFSPNKNGGLADTAYYKK